MKRLSTQALAPLVTLLVTLSAVAAAAVQPEAHGLLDLAAVQASQQLFVGDED
ncbi:MAG: hypothetical protein QM750_09525 [Rubrivivax sp.]